jgi:hypothetical protein
MSKVQSEPGHSNRPSRCEIFPWKMVSLRAALWVLHILQTGQERPENEEIWPPPKTIYSFGFTNGSFKYLGNRFSTQPLTASQNNYS